ncbi:cancer/testis antigen family 45 member A10 [Pongo pygmaeus]|uniref:cancer/testis antigen family 45 member A10 n=1 Tax=Pongo abelii TaxID=9601 RepID=UPI0023E1BD47|nr:cancer/testis antigen family 45 member A10 [Pongo abelii]XP_024096385.2 cancer/testis antigen family 45 member A10 [Pongo abelii]XP_024096386.2 cancer/testis antigen family 45 member A10 [Pongo abelii]XP_024096387.2 cancer/testis antigen family 45 member A10 [Pongo abelii]XP_054327627.1 cancer/testis antigen family 45 member A10 [Pongo pygmaeus]XP_054327628.1 cancer/testis antigen family 45 member A10 [Pongo pygmaeus]XP_054327629.1 cancer/testis antigen family 45 member A10 [Pongo pygmaeus
MTDKTEKVSVDPETVFKRPRECDSPSYQKRQRMALLARKQGAGDSLIAGSAMSKEKKLMTGGALPPSQLDYQIDDFTGFSKDGMMQKPGSNAPVGGNVTSSFSGDDLECRETVPFPKSQEEINADIKCQVVKEIRCIGRKYEKIFKMLEGVQGPTEVRKRFFESIVKEAARCMRRDFVKHLKKKLKRMI